MASSRQRPVPATLDPAAGPRSVLRVLQILHDLAHHPEGRSLTSLSHTLGVPKTSLFSLLRALEIGSYVVSSGGHHRLGIEALKLGAAINQNIEFPKSVRPIMEKLASETHETVILATMASQGYEAVYVDVIEAESPLRFSGKVGDRRPLYASSAGKVLLAYAPEQVRRKFLAEARFVRFTPDTITNRSALLREIAKIRHDGIAVNVNGMLDGVIGIAAPGFDEHGAIVAAIGVAAPTSRVVKRKRLLTALAREAGEQMSRLLNYQGTYPPPLDSAKASP
jgi:DNA-binding IclR family transcriptional regulator